MIDWSIVFANIIGGSIGLAIGLLYVYFDLKKSEMI